MRRSLDIYDLIISFIIFILVIGIIIGISFIIDKTNDKKWNDGYCQCGGEYVYTQAIGHQYSTGYLYECNKCGKIYESHKKR